MRRELGQVCSAIEDKVETLRTPGDAAAKILPNTAFLFKFNLRAGLLPTAFPLRQIDLWQSLLSVQVTAATSLQQPGSATDVQNFTFSPSTDQRSSKMPLLTGLRGLSLENGLFVSNWRLVRRAGANSDSIQA